MNKYEVMYVIDATLEDSARAELIARFSDLVTKNGGEIERIDEWGKRRLAYAINYKTDGYYVLMYIKAPSDLPKELERNFQIHDLILRYLVIRYEGELPAKVMRRETARPFIQRRQSADDADTPPAIQPVQVVGAETEAAPVEEAPAEEAPVEAVLVEAEPVEEAADNEAPESIAE